MGYTAGSQPTGALWTQASLAVAALLSLRRILSRHLALLGLPVVLLWYNIRWSADKLAMAGGTPCKTSCSITDRASTQGGTTGNELYGKLSRLLLLTLAHQKRQGVPLGMPSLNAEMDTRQAQAGSLW